MEDGVDDTAILVRRKLEEDCKGKATDQGPSVGLMNNGIAERSALNREKLCIDAAQKFHTQAQ